MNRLGAAAAILVLASVAVPQESEALGGSRPWWPDPDAGPGPDALHDGWNLRVPLRVENRQGTAVAAGAPAQAHIDLAAAMLAGGWPGGVVPKSFRMDPGSVRLVEYGPGWLEERGEVAFKMFTGWLEPDQRTTWGKVQALPFDPTTRPYLTLEWRTAGDLAVSGQGSFAHYYLYFDIDQNNRNPGDSKPPASFTASQQESLSAFYWVGSGTLVFGDHPGSATQAPTLQVISTLPGTTVAVHTYRGLAIPQLDAQPGQPNPFTIQTAGGVARYSFGPDPTQFMVSASAPVVVASHRGGTGSGDFVPSLQGGPLGRQHVVPALAQRIVVSPIDASAPANVCVDERGPAAPDCRTVGVATANRVFQLSTDQQSTNPANPARAFDVTSSQPVLVQYVPASASPAWSQAPSVLGAPTGTRFLAVTVASAEGGFLATPSMPGASVRIHDAVNDRQEDSPLGPAGQPTHLVGADLQFACPGCPRGQRDDTWPQHLESLANGASSQVPVQVHFGSGEAGQPTFSTPWGGAHGIEFMVQGGFLVHAFYNTTRVTVDGMEHPLSPVDLGVPVRVERAASAVTRIQADKPISVLPTVAPGSYARFHAARPAFLAADVLPGEYRGYLVDIQPTAGADPVFINALPGDEVSIPFRITNLARWNGVPLADTVTLSAASTMSTVPATFQEVSMPMQGGAVRENALLVSLPDDMPPNAAVTFTVQATSVGNQRMASTFTAVVFSRQSYAVDAWFGGPTSTSGDTEAYPRLEVGTEEAYPFVIRNKGSGVDSFDIALSVPDGGWEARIVSTDGSGIDRFVGVPPGEMRAGQLLVRAPDSDALAAATIVVDITSATSASATATLLLDARLRLEQGIELTSPDPRRPVPPGGSTQFKVIATNTGQDAISLALDLGGLLPTGWTARIEDIAEDTMPTLMPGQAASFTIRVSATDSAPADQRISLLMTAKGSSEGDTARDAIALHAEVQRLLKLHMAEPIAAIVRPGSVLNGTMSVGNLGNGDEAIDMVAPSVPPGWNLTAKAEPAVPAGSTKAFPFTLKVPAGAPAGSHNITLRAQSLNGANATVTLRVVVEPKTDLGWEQPPALTLRASQATLLALNLSNTGNLPRTLRLDAEAPAGWDVVIEPASATLPAGRDLLVLASIRVSGQAAEGPATVLLRASDAAGRASTVVPVRVEEAHLVLKEVRAAEPRNPGGAGFVAVTFENPGNVQVLDVTVRLQNQGETIDEVSFASIGPGGQAVGLLQWVDGMRPDTIAWSIGGLPADTKPIEVAAARELPAAAGAPFPSALLAIAALAFGLLARRRRP